MGEDPLCPKIISSCDHDDELQCPKCNVVNSFTKKHIQICKRSRKTSSGWEEKVPSAKCDPLVNAKEAGDRPCSVTVDGFVKLNEDEKANLEIMENSVGANDPVYQKDLLKI